MNGQAHLVREGTITGMFCTGSHQSGMISPRHLFICSTRSPTKQHHWLSTTEAVRHAQPTSSFGKS